MTQHDKRLIEEAKSLRWEEINEDAAETQEGRKELHRITMQKYHRDEFKAFGIC